MNDMSSAITDARCNGFHRAISPHVCWGACISGVAGSNLLSLIKRHSSGQRSWLSSSKAGCWSFLCSL